MFKKSIYLAGLLVLTLPVLSHSQLLRQPESAVYDKARGRYLVSNYYNGRIIAIDTNGTLSVFAEGKNSSAGLHIIGDTVYVGCGSQGVLAYNLVTGEVVMDVLILGSVLLNDITSDTSGNLYVSDPYGNKIYKIRLEDRSYSVLVDYVYWPNGLLFIEELNMLLGCSSTTQKIFSIDMDSGSMTELVDVASGHIDGLAEDCAGNIYVSAQGPDVVYRYNRDFTSPREMVSSGHSAPADIYYNKSQEILVVPNIAGNTVDFVHLPAPTRLTSHNFADDTYGDGDGILEGGEEIELTFSFANPRPDTMLNTQVNLYCQDMLIGMFNDYVDFGNLPPGEVADNALSPMRFTVPADYKARIDSFYIEISYTFRGIDEKDSVVILQHVGFPGVLLVDDFAGEGISDYYEETLEEMSIPYGLWDIQTMGIPLSGELNEYPVVIWFTGTSGADSLDGDHILSLKDCMDSGGNLFLTGQAIAANIDLLDVGFLHDYLRCEQQSPFYMAVLNTLSAGQAFAAGDTVVITSGDGASNQSQTDHISCINGSVEELHYMTTANCAAVSYAGEYKLVFFAFGFEAIRSDDSRFLSRISTLEKVLAFFGFELPNTAPTASGLTISPGDPTHMTDHVPEISWMYSDGESAPQAYYHIQLGSDDDWVECEMWDSGPVTGSEVNVLYSGTELLDGEDYHVRLRSCDGSLWSDWIYGTFHMNSVPVPADLTPNNLEETDVNPPVLSHAIMLDAEGDVLTYDYQLYGDIEMTVLLDEDSGVAADPGERMYWQTETLLDENEDFYWRARSRDDYESGTWSEPASFVVIPSYVCGDANGDGIVNVGDAVFLINYIFKSGTAPDPECAADVNGDGIVNVGDGVYLINFIFKSGLTPVEDCCG